MGQQLRDSLPHPKMFIKFLIEDCLGVAQVDLRKKDCLKLDLHFPHRARQHPFQPLLSFSSAAASNNSRASTKNASYLGKNHPKKATFLAVCCFYHL